MELKIVLFLVSIFVSKSAANLLCYACSFSTSDSDQSCLTLTEDTNVVDCSYTYCTIFRQEFVDPSGVVASFTRGCEMAPDYLNHEITDPTFRTFYRACTEDLCNIGNGIESISGGSLAPSVIYNGINLLVPGTGGSISVTSHKSTLIFVVSVALALLKYH